MNTALTWPTLLSSTSRRLIGPRPKFKALPHAEEPDTQL